MFLLISCHTNMNIYTYRPNGMSETILCWCQLCFRFIAHKILVFCLVSGRISDVAGKPIIFMWDFYFGEYLFINTLVIRNIQYLNKWHLKKTIYGHYYLYEINRCFAGKYVSESTIVVGVKIMLPQIN